MTRRALGTGPSTPKTNPPPQGPQPVDVRLIGDDTAVRRLVAAMQTAGHCGPASFRPMRGGEGTRAYLTVVVPEAAS